MTFRGVFVVMYGNVVTMLEKKGDHNVCKEKERITQNVQYAQYTVA